MTAELAWAAAGWACAAGSLLSLAVVRRRIAGRLALVAEASHELRGPIAAVQLGLASLARDAEPDRARRAAALDLELRRAGRALADLDAAPAGRRAPDTAGLVDAGDLLEEAREAWAPLAAALGTTVTAEPLAEWWVVRGDRVRIAQAVGNLVANAIEHGRGPVRLAARPAGDRLAIEVRDGGRGLPGALPAGAGHAGRRGHGLSIAAGVARDAGGALRSHRRPDGHAMVLELPLALPPAGALAVGSAGAAAGEGVR